MSRVLLRNNFTEIDKVRLFNIYGITEVSVWSICHEVNHSTTSASVPPSVDETANHVSNLLGNLYADVLSGTECVVLDDDGNEVPLSFDV